MGAQHSLVERNATRTWPVGLEAKGNRKRAEASGSSRHGIMNVRGRVDREKHSVTAFHFAPTLTTIVSGQLPRNVHFPPVLLRFCSPVKIFSIPFIFLYVYGTIVFDFYQ